jgi:hypothetical protein
VHGSSLAPAALVAAAVAACGGGGDGTGDDVALYDCALEEDDDTFVAGLEKISASGVRFRIMSSVPAPPARGDNHFVVHLIDAAGAPQAGAALSVVQFMPSHGHGSSVPVIITESATVLGEYDVNPVNFHMNKLWQVFMSTSANEADRVMFAFCIP